MPRGRGASSGLEFARAAARGQRVANRRERSYGSFRRDIALPDAVDPESIKASFENGVLEVTMPMPKESRLTGRTIPISPKQGSDPDVH